jgi:peptidoglycan/LPS O-acetylase OafA/YrhL
VGQRYQANRAFRGGGNVTHQKRYLPTLDGWRGLAVIGVILYHGRLEFFNADSDLARLALHGFLGVDLFFAISGFLICGLLLQEYHTNGGISLRRFYIRRCFRILPPYYAVLVVICAVSILGVIHLNYSYLPSCLLFYRNYKPLGLDEQHGFYTAHYWTLAIEEHFYLIWPMLLIAVKPKRAGKVAFLLAMAVFAWRGLQSHFQWFATILLPANLLARTDTRADALLWGCLAAIYFPTIVRYSQRIHFSQLWLPILAILIVIEKLHPAGLIILRAILMPALVLSTVIQPASWLGSVLDWQPLHWLGSISYSLYLWQELFLPEVASENAHGAFHYLQQPPWNLLAILICACLSRYLLELPMTRLGHRWSETVPGRNSSPRPTLSPNLQHEASSRRKSRARPTPAA